jgi:hypothetical protein
VLFVGRVESDQLAREVERSPMRCWLIDPAELVLHVGLLIAAGLKDLVRILEVVEQRS